MSESLFEQPTEPTVEFGRLMQVAANADLAHDEATRDEALARIEEMTTTGEIDINAIRQMAELDKFYND